VIIVIELQLEHWLGVEHITVGKLEILESWCTAWRYL